MTPQHRPRDVLVVDDHRLFADLLALAVDGHPDLRCVGVETCLDGVVARLRASPVDVAVVDVRLGTEDGLAAVDLVRAARPAAAVVVLTGYPDPPTTRRAGALGVAALLDKRAPVAEVLRAIVAARPGRSTVLRSDASPASPTPVEVPAWAPRLTTRERQVLDGLAEGHDPRVIAVALGISLNTCRGYVQQVLQKLGAHSQLEAVAVARRCGLLREPQRLV